MSGFRSSSFVTEEYNKTWSFARQCLDEVLGAGERDLFRVVTQTRERFARGQENEKQKRKFEKNQIERRRDGYLFDQQLILERTCDQLTSSLMLEVARLRFVVQAAEHAERVIELGSGWGKNSFKVWLYGGPRDAEYHVYDLNPIALEMARHIAATCGGPKVVTREFNYYEPDFSHLSNKRTVVFTNYSIEQIPEVSRELIVAISEIPGFQRCVHLEPVGPQIQDPDWLTQDPSAGETIDRLHQEMLLKNDMNKNLMPVLLELQEERRIVVRSTIKNHSGVSLRNPCSVIEWELKE